MSLNKQRRRKIRLKLIRLHQRLGLVVTVLVLLVSVTGILLNHTEELTLDQQPVASSWLISLYGIPLPKVYSYQVGEQWINGVGDKLYFGNWEVTYCANHLSAVVGYQQMLVAACGDGLVLLTQEGEVIERLGASLGLPLPIQSMSVHQDDLLLKTNDKTVLANLDGLNWRVIEPPLNLVWTRATGAPTEMVKRLQYEFVGAELTLERVILDVHSGRLATKLGVWLIDLSALLMIFLALSGLWVWFSKKRH